MNTLSWFIYLADVIPSLGTFLIVFGVIAMLASIVTWFVTTLAWDDNRENIAKAKANFKKVSATFFFFCWIMIVVGILIPSRQTFFMIAASESAEVVVTNPKVQEIFGDLTTIIQTELKDVIKSKTGTGERNRND